MGIPDAALTNLTVKESNMAERDSTRVIPHTCVVCETIFTPVKLLMRKHGRRYTAYTGAKTCSKQCEFARMRQFDESRAEAIKAATTGPKNHNWRGGSSCLQRGYHGPEWPAIAEKARKRDGYSCQRCHITQKEHGSTLHVHHIIPAANFTNIKKSNQLTNLMTLCTSCHFAVEAKSGPVQIPLFSGLSRSERKGVRARGDRVFGSKMTDSSVAELRKLYANGETTRDLAQKFGLAQSSTHAIATGKAWSHIPLPDYKNRPNTNGEAKKTAKLTEAVVKEIRRLFCSGESTASIGRILGLRQSTAWLIAHRKTWKNVL